MSSTVHHSVTGKRPDEGLEPIAVSIAQACKVSGLSRPTIYRCVASGQLPTRKLGARTLVLVEDLKSFLRNLPRGRIAGCKEEDGPALGPIGPSWPMPGQTKSFHAIDQIGLPNEQDYSCCGARLRCRPLCNYSRHHDVCRQSAGCPREPRFGDQYHIISSRKTVP
ncbi:helix-turn-helix domain-containing protein [Devosia sp.]|uniref:helix-turn-helix domain-containing protein n=1 Tax=Devosia sp. TaxID=1871048 RepID=UPI0035B44E98